MINPELREQYDNLLRNCLNMPLNVCDECPSKERCCQIAINNYYGGY